LSSLAAEVERGESLSREVMARSTRLSDPSHPSPLDLLALQAGVCRYSEAVDLVSRLVDRAAGSVRTVLQGGQS
jgi:hypothetical protein